MEEMKPKFIGKLESKVYIKSKSLALWAFSENQDSEK